MAEANKTILPVTKDTGVSPTLQNASAWLDLINGTSSSTSTSGGTTTKETDVTAAGIAQLMQQMLDGTGGLADVASGAHAAGLYGDTTQSLLTQQLLTKIAGQAALESAKTTTTTTPATTTSKVAPQLTAKSGLESLAMAGLTAAAGKVAKKSGIMDVLGLGDDKTGPGGAVAINAGSGASTMTPSFSQSPGGFMSDPTGNMTSVDLGAGSGDVSTSTSDFDASSPASDVLNNDAGLSSVSTDLGDSFLGGDVGNYLPDAGNTVSDVASGAGDAFEGLFSFKRGGTVKTSKGEMKGYASGGIVDLKMPGPDAPDPSHPVTDAYRSDPVSTASRPTSSSNSGDVETGVSGADPASAGGGNPTNIGTPSLSQAGQIALGIIGLTSPIGLAGTMLSMGTGKGLFGNVAEAAGFGSNGTPPGGGASPVGSSSAGNSGGQMSDASTDDSGTGSEDSNTDAGSAGSTGGISAGTGNSGAGLSFDPGAAGDVGTGSSIDPGDASGSSEGMSGAGGASGSVGGDGGLSGAGEGFEGYGGYGGGDPGDAGEPGGGDAGGGSEPGFADGGPITADGDGSEDTTYIKAANNEFMLNANAVKAIGIDKLVWLNHVLGGQQ